MVTVVSLVTICNHAKSLQYYSLYFPCCTFHTGFLVTQLCLTLYDLMDCSMPGFPVLHYLLEFAQTHVNWVRDAIQPSHPLSLVRMIIIVIAVPFFITGFWILIDFPGNVLCFISNSHNKLTRLSKRQNHHDLPCLVSYSYQWLRPQVLGSESSFTSLLVVLPWATKVIFSLSVPWFPNVGI